MVVVLETPDPLLQIDVRVTLICLLLHSILCHDQVLFKGTKKSSQTVSVWSTSWTFEVLGKYERTEGGLCPYTASKGVMQVDVW